MRAIMVMFDSLNRRMLEPYRGQFPDTPNFTRLAQRSVTFENFYVGSMPCMPARRELHTGRHNFLHRAWGPLEPFDDSMPQLLSDHGTHTHLITDHNHYWEDGGATYHTRYTSCEFERGQEGDGWKGHAGTVPSNKGRVARVRAQDQVNRGYMAVEEDHVQTRTVNDGLHFLETNAEADNWFLQLEMFDPHEPFFVPQSYLDACGDTYQGAQFDWPPYQKVIEDDATVDHVKRSYAALLAMCDYSLGRVLDAMDRLGLWEDTMLIVNTDHGYILGEHGWWGKGAMPWFNELANTPFFLWDPRSGVQGERRSGLAQTIDIPVTLLSYFGAPVPEDMQGGDLAQLLTEDRPMRDGAIYGIHGGHVNVTDGRYTYFRAPDRAENGPLEEYTLMPTRMGSRFTIEELSQWEPAEPFGFTKGLRTMRTVRGSAKGNAYRHGTLLFDLANDPGQLNPIVDDEVELRMLGLLQQRMQQTEAPASQYERLGIPMDRPVSVDDPRVCLHHEQAAEIAEPLPPATDFQCPDRFTVPVRELLEDAGCQAVLTQVAPELVQGEGLTMNHDLTLLRLAASLRLTAAQLRDLDAEFASLTGVSGG